MVIADTKNVDSNSGKSSEKDHSNAEQSKVGGSPTSDKYEEHDRRMSHQLFSYSIIDRIFKRPFDSVLAETLR